MCDECKLFVTVALGWDDRTAVPDISGAITLCSEYSSQHASVL